MIKKLIASILFSAILCTAIPVYAIPYGEYMSGREEYMSASYMVSPGLTYTETLTKNEKYGYERSYVYEYTPSMGTEIIPSCGEYVYGTESLGTLTKQLEIEGKRVVGGINGDFYSTSTGVPIGAMIIDGEVITSDNERTAMGFDADGNAFISKPNIVTKLYNEDCDISIEHINKYPLEYCLYLLTDRFYPTTKTSKASYEIVLMPYSESVTYFSEEDLPNDEDDEETEEYVFIYPEKDEITEENLTEEENKENPETSTEEVVTVTDLPENEQTTDITDENTEESIQDSIHEETLTEDTEIEDVPEEEEPEYYAKRYTFADEKIKIGSEIKVVVTEIRKDSINSNIPKGSFVLCAENVLQYDRIKDLETGSELTLSVSADEEWYEAVNAIGNSGGLILKDGEYCDDVEIDHYPYAHPRTAAGITEDGRVIFYCVDGRQQTSGGLRIDQLSHEMKKLGCVIAMNLDGGGSTTAYAALPGEALSTIKNSPSVSPERKTANSLLFVNTTERLDEIWSYSIFPENPYVLAGGSKYKLSAPIPTDKNLHPINLPDDAVYEYYTSPITTDSRIIDGNIFVSGEKSGRCDIYLRVWQDAAETEDEDIPEWEDRSVRDYRVGHIFVLDTPQDFSVGEEEYNVSPFDTVDLDFSAKYHGADIYYTDDSLRWHLPDEALPKEEEEPDDTLSEETEPKEDLNENISEETKEEIYFPIPTDNELSNDKLSISQELCVSFKTHGESLILKAKTGKLIKEIRFNIDKFPFTDSFTHWSAKNLYEIHSYGLMQGEPDGDGFAFLPQRNLTKAEFLTVLARMLYPDIDNEKEEVIEGSKEAEDPMETNAETESEEQNVLDLETETEEAEIGTEEKVPEDENNISAPKDSNKTEEQTNPKEEENEEAEATIFADDADIPDWARKYFDALDASGLLQLIAQSDENGDLYIRAKENISRTEVLILLGALSDETDVDFVGTFTDTQKLYTSPHFAFINNALSAKIFEGYEDGSLRADNDLTRAEAATVILRFFENRATE